MSFIGIPLKDGVIKQLNKRADILSKENKNVNEIRYLTGRSAWVRMISGVDTEEGSKLAQSLVLSGGELKWNSNSKTFNKTQSISFEPSSIRRKYNYDEDLGIRPQAGLTSFKIASKNRFGSIRQASLSFNVWTREDLEKVQTLFLRPGFPCVVEWGNSVYCTNNGVIENFIDDYDYNELFTKKDFRKLNNILQEKKKKYDYNYDNFIGLITNFNWSFREDGGYECSLTVVTYGTLLSSLTVKKSSNTPEPTDQNNEKTILHSFLNRLNIDKLSDRVVIDLNLPEIRNIEYGINLIQRFFSNINISIAGAFLSSFSTGNFTTKLISQNLYSNLVTQLGRVEKFENILKIIKFKVNDNLNDIYVNYLSIRQFLALCNISFDIQGISKEESIGCSFSLEEGNKYATFDNHFSINPMIAILPKFPSQEELQEVRVFGKRPDENKFREQKSTNPFKDIDKKIEDSKVFAPDDILEIRVTSNLLLSKLDDFVNSSENPSTLSVLDFVKSVFQDIQEALGEINEFDIAYNENTNKYEVVDRKVNPLLSKQTTTKSIPVLNYFGKRSLFKSLSLDSKISSELASMISISAGTDNNVQLNTDQALIDWNEGLTSRFPFSYIEPVVDNRGVASYSTRQAFDIAEARKKELQNKKILEENLAVKRNVYLQNLTNAYRAFNNSSYDKELFNKIKIESIERIRNAFYFYSKGIGVIPGLIPIELSFSMDGIGGFDIGEVFTLVEKGKRSLVLPSKYENYGFIITGLDHSIDSNGKWITNVKGTTFKLYTEPDTSIEIQNKAGII